MVCYCLSAMPTYLILYELPSFGVHHFSSSNWSSLNDVGIPFKKPNWLSELYQKQSTFELDTVILSLNCANAVKDSLKTCLGIKGSLNQSSTMSMLTMTVWHMVAVWVASISTFLYIILQFFYRCFSHASKSLFYMILAKLFNQTWKNVHVRSRQLLYWPILLQGSGSRGRKWNPLRVRLDSYDYTVEQHVVGSLLFTPVMLLLPTTSVFYIFFTIMTSTISFICIVIEVAISIHHATPYAEIFMWMVSKRRFPSGLWFKITCDHISPRSGEDSELSSLGMVHGGNGVQGQTVVSFLQSNYASIGQIVRPHYRNIFPSTSGMSSVNGLLIGQRFPSTLGMCLPTTMPWMSIRSGEYWRLCRSSVLACTSKI